MGRNKSIYLFVGWLKAIGNIMGPLSIDSSAIALALWPMTNIFPCSCAGPYSDF